MDGISCGHLAFLDLQIGRGLRRTMFTAVLTHRFRRIMYHFWYSLSWQRAADQTSAADSLAHCCRPVSGDTTSNSVLAMLLDTRASGIIAVGGHSSRVVC